MESAFFKINLFALISPTKFSGDGRIFLENRLVKMIEYFHLVSVINRCQYITRVGVTRILVGLSNSASGCDGEFDILFLSRLRTCRAASDRVSKWCDFLSWLLRDRQSARFGPALGCRLFTIVVTIIDRLFLRLCPKSPSVAASRLRRWSQLPVGLI